MMLIRKYISVFVVLVAHILVIVLANLHCQTLQWYIVGIKWFIFIEFWLIKSRNELFSKWTGWLMKVKHGKTLIQLVRTIL